MMGSTPMTTATVRSATGSRTPTPCCPRVLVSLLGHFGALDCEPAAQHLQKGAEGIVLAALPQVGPPVRARPKATHGQAPAAVAAAPTMVERTPENWKNRYVFS